jgi:peptide/nickel transport system ATP-binding protein
MSNAETPPSPPPVEPPAEKPLVDIKNLSVHFPVKGGIFLRTQNVCKAVDGVDLQLFPGETLGLVGESGCGKSTLGKTLVRLIEPTGGTIQFDGQDITHMNRSQLKPIRKKIQMVFQDPADSLNSRHTVGKILEEPLVIHRQGDRAWREKKVAELLDQVGLPASAAEKFPFEFSGGQRQRIGIARSLALRPSLIVCDEPVSALDVSIQSQVLNLFLDLQTELKLTYLFIAHDLAVVKHVSDRIAIMYLGRIMEITDADTVYRDPRHPYTRALIEAIPEPKPKRRVRKKILEGDVPSPIHQPSGCPFHTRCPFAEERCRVERPELREVGTSGKPHQLACHFDL